MHPLALFILLGLAACLPGKKSVKTEFRFQLAGITATQPGGLMIYGRENSGAQVFGQRVNNDSLSIDLINGAWTFYAIAWNGANPMTGTLRCALQTAQLDGSSVSVSLNLTQTNCNSPIFSPADALVAGTSSPLSFYSCSDITGLNATETCSLTQGDHQSVEIIFENFLGADATQISTNLTRLKSSCLPLTGNLIESNLKIPLGSTQLIQPVRIRAYKDSTCTSSTPDQYFFPNGLSAATSSNAALLNKTSVPEMTKIFLLSSPPVIASATLAASIVNNLTSTIDINDASISAGVEIFSDATCTQLRGSATAASLPVSVSITLPADGTYQLYAQQVIGSNRSVCSALLATITADTTPPAPATGLALSTPYTTNINTIQFSWIPGVDSLSGLVQQELRFYSDASCTAENFGLYQGPGAEITFTNVTFATDGTYYFQLRGIDAAGNASSTACSSPLTIDRVAPLTATSLLWSSSLSNLTTQTVTWTPSSSPDLNSQTILLYADGICSAQTSANILSSAQNSYVFPSLIDSTYSFTIRSRDAAGNESLSACSPPITIDTIAAAPTGLLLLTPVTSPSTIANPIIQVQGVEIGGQVEVFTDLACTLQVGSSATVAANQNVTITLSTDNTYSLYARQIDEASNISGCMGPLNYTLDTTPPTPPTILGVTGGSDLLIDALLTDGTAVSVNFEADGDTNEVKIAWYDISGNLFSSHETLDAISPQPVGYPLAPGIFRMGVIAVDQAGNESTEVFYDFQVGWGSNVSAESARNNHTAIWSGSHAFVWGGQDSAGQYQNTGSYFDPLTDLWTPMTGGTPPIARIHHTAIFNPLQNHMIVWGGDDRGQYLHQYRWKI